MEEKVLIRGEFFSGEDAENFESVSTATKTSGILFFTSLVLFILFLLVNIEYAGFFLYLTPILFIVYMTYLRKKWVLESKKNMELVVTDRRVYGVHGKGKNQARTDLPLDEISAVETNDKINSLSVKTSGGTIIFYYCYNKQIVFNTISSLLRERQNKQSEAVKPAVAETSNADELKKYKDLLDSGIITQEEFDLKKKQLLGL